jgi:RNA polymerase sigma factor (sigma-70 family)
MGWLTQHLAHQDRRHRPASDKQDPLVSEHATGESAAERPQRHVNHEADRREHQQRSDPHRARRGDLEDDHHRRDRSELTDQIDERLLPASDGPEEQIIGSPELSEALGRLNDREREILALRFGGDLSGPQIAELLDLTLANVQQITSRSLRRLRELLEGGGAQSPDQGGGAQSPD